MTADEIRNVAMADFVDIESAKAYFLREIAAQLAESNFLFALQLEELRKRRIDTTEPRREWACPHCGILLYSENVLRNHVDTVHGGKNR